VTFALSLAGGALVAFSVTIWLTGLLGAGVIAAIEFIVLSALFLGVLHLLKRFRLTTWDANPLVACALALIAVMYVSLSTAGA